MYRELFHATPYIGCCFIYTFHFKTHKYYQITFLNIFEQGGSNSPVYHYIGKRGLARVFLLYVLYEV